MNNASWSRFLRTYASKRKSKTCGERSRTIQKRPCGPIWVGLVALVLAFVGLASGAGAQPKKVARLGYLSPVDAARESTQAKAILLALHKLGYIEGQNIAIEYRYAEGKLDRLPKLLPKN